MRINYLRIIPLGLLVMRDIKRFLNIKAFI